MLLWALLVIFVPISEQADWLTLLAPSSVFEGDSIVLMCKGKDDWKIKTMTYYKDRRELFFFKVVSAFHIPSAALSDSGEYYCTATGRTIISWTETSKRVNIDVHELFPSPVLMASSFQPTEGSPVTLTCKTQLPLQKADVQLQFSFFRDGRTLGSGWSHSPEFQIPTMRTEDSGYYWCEAVTMTHVVRKRSQTSQIHVQRVPVSNVRLEAWAAEGQVIEGRKLVLLCSVAKGTGNITFSWHKEATGACLGKMTQPSLSAKLEIPALKESDAGKYHCRADNGHGPIQSKVVHILVRLLVSRPILTLRVPGVQPVVGGVLELHCKALRGSPPILYQFYHEDITLGNVSAPSGGGASFNLSLTTEHSGNYSCEADNGLGAQRSEAVAFFIPGPDGYRGDLVTVMVLGGLFGVLGITGVALLYYCWPHRAASSRNPQEPTPSSPLPATEEQQSEYVNVGSIDVDVIYSQVWSIQQPEVSANIRRTLENEDSQVIYSAVKEK
ncbi:Fc receptor-like protein 2 [Tupaia chinensis]|uniref:Fc receptor-like protein 2 n=1 Tax=Tupaia chinensis TaxID=246437 RepID=L9JFN7_TUPCH|nr:Fc receptor-like protein 2 [Tupaia chinensis]